jgi:secondary thiamine-phosphate synthase enzyme
MESLTVRSSQESEFINITSETRSMVSTRGIKNGSLFLYVPHTTAGITINESADRNVVHDILADLDRLFPRRQSYYRHAEGNSASHMKASLMGSSVRVMIQDGDLVLGTWQGIFLCEFDGPRTRRVIVKISAEEKPA